MRRIVIVFISTILFADENLLTHTELEKETVNTKNKISTLKSPDQKLKEIAQLNTIFLKNIKFYKEKYPQKGPKEELDILMLYYSLEPVFDLQKKNLNKENCEAKEHQIQLEDGRTSNGKVSNNAQLALDILKLICPK